jgi:hypothetical protein
VGSKKSLYYLDYVTKNKKKIVITSQESWHRLYIMKIIIHIYIHQEALNNSVMKNNNNNDHQIDSVQ